jgi:hypothetical protein
MKTLKPATAAILAIEFYLILSAACVACLLMRTNGQFIYPLDDTYISMAMAKNLAQHGIMGLTRYEFSASSSCPLWILLIAATYCLTGVTWWVPLVLGFIAGFAVVLVGYRILLSHTENALVIGSSLAALCFLTPLPALALSGMEHTFHIALVLLFAAAACRYLGRDSSFSTADLYRILALVAVMAMVRYESLFLAAIFSALALLRRKWLPAGLVMIAATVPVLLFGLISVSQGWGWLPNSVLLKGNMPQLSSARGILMFLGLRSLRMLFLTPHLLGLTGLLAAAWWIGKARHGVSFWAPPQLMLFMAVAALVLHLQFASVGWFFRYEAYLVALGVMALACNRFDATLREIFSPAAWRCMPLVSSVAVLALLLAILPMAGRAGEAVAGFQIAAYNVFEQQYQMAGFLNRYYNGASIAANDVGAINYVNDLHCLDLVGLCNRNIFGLKRRRAYDTQAMDALTAAAHVRVALVYKTWFDGKAGPPIPANWTPVGEWHVTDNGFLGGDTVTFYAVQPEETEYLAWSLHNFSSRLPASVIQTISPPRPTTAADDGS